MMASDEFVDCIALQTCYFNATLMLLPNMYKCFERDQDDELGVCGGAYSMCPLFSVAMPSLPGSACLDFDVPGFYGWPGSFGVPSTRRFIGLWLSPSCSSAISTASCLLLSCSSLVQHSSINLCSSANLVPSFGMNLQRHLALNDPGSRSPFSDSRV